MNEQATERAIESAESAALEAIREIEQEIEDVQTSAKVRVKELRERKRAFEAAAGRKRAKRDLTSRKIAGPAAIELVEQYLIEHGTGFQADITSTTGLNSGTVTHALRALAEDAKIAATGEVRRGSPQFSYTGKTAKRRSRARVKTTA